MLRFRRPVHRPHLVVAGGQGALALLGALSTVVYARLLGPSGRGGLALLQTMPSIAATVGLLGLPTLIVRRKVLDVRPEVVAAAYGTACLAAALTTALVGSAVLLSGGSTLSAAGVTGVTVLLACAHTVVLVSVEGVAATTQARQLFVRLTGLRLAMAAVPVLVVVVVGLVSRSPAVLYAAIVLSALATSAVSAVTVLGRDGLSRTLSAVGSVVRRPLHAGRALWASGSGDPELRAVLSSHVALTLLLFVYRLDLILLGVLSTAREVGIYVVSYSVAEIAWLFVNGHAITLLPRLVSLPGDEGALLLRGVVRRSVVVSAAAVLVLAATVQPVIVVLLGAQFSDSYPVFLVLVPGILAFVPFKLTATWLVATGRPAYLSRLCAVLVLLNVVLLAVLAPGSGARGAGLACAITYSVGAVALRHHLRSGVRSLATPRPAR